MLPTCFSSLSPFVSTLSHPERVQSPEFWVQGQFSASECDREKGKETEKEKEIEGDRSDGPEEVKPKNKALGQTDKGTDLRVPQGKLGKKRATVK